MGVLELRQYTLKPGQRDVLIGLFDEAFVESQEEVGADIVGQFRDLHDPDRFVWLRSFQDMSARRDALKAFYGGPVWRANREAANATMIDSGNVLLLKPVRPTSAFVPRGERAPRGTSRPPRGLVTATVCHPGVPAEQFFDTFSREIAPVLQETGAMILASYVTESEPNSFPVLPVREGENVFVWFSLFQDLKACEAHVDALAQSETWRGAAAKALAKNLEKPPEILWLTPTARSRLHA